MKKIIGALAAGALVITMGGCTSQAPENKPAAAHTRTDNEARRLSAHKADTAVVKEKKARKHREVVQAAKRAEQRRQDEIKKAPAPSSDPLAACRAAHGGSDEMCNDADPRIPGTSAYEKKQYDDREQYYSHHKPTHDLVDCSTSSDPICDNY